MKTERNITIVLNERTLVRKSLQLTLVPTCPNPTPKHMAAIHAFQRSFTETLRQTGTSNPRPVICCLLHALAALGGPGDFAIEPAQLRLKPLCYNRLL